MSSLEEYLGEVRQYLAEGECPCLLVRCVLANDLFGAYWEANRTDHGYLSDLVGYVCSHAPMDALGSHDAVEVWIREKGFRGWDVPAETLAEWQAKLERAC